MEWQEDLAMKVQFFDFERYHNKKNIGSTWLRVHNLIKYWPEASLYRYGDSPDVLIFQKVYATQDYRFPLHYKGIKILDIADPDWIEHVGIKETIDAMDAVVCCTEPLAQFIRQLTDQPVVVMPDRHDLEPAPKLKDHQGPAKKLIWFGYRHNTDVLKPFIRQYEDSDYELTILSNEDPVLERSAYHPDKWRGRLKWVLFEQETLYHYLSQHDLALLPDGNRPVDRFKSNNKTVIGWLAGLPIIKTPEDLERFLDPDERNKEAKENWEVARRDYDVVRSVAEYKNLIHVIKNRTKC